jgi:hypothetical protein
MRWQSALIPVMQVAHHCNGSIANFCEMLWKVKASTSLNSNGGNFDYNDWASYPILNVTFDRIGESHS